MPLDEDPQAAAIRIEDWLVHEVHEPLFQRSPRAALKLGAHPPPHVRLTAGDHLVEQRGPRPAVFQELHDRLTALYPCMSSVPDDRIDDTVWSDGPLINNFGHRAAVLGIAYSRIEEVLPVLVETANALGLVVFDWATAKVYRA